MSQGTVLVHRVDVAKRLLAEQDDPAFTRLHLNSSYHAYLPPKEYLV